MYTDHLTGPGGAEGTLDQLRAAVFTARLNDQPIETLLPDDPAAAADSGGPAATDSGDRATRGGQSAAGATSHDASQTGRDQPPAGQADLAGPGSGRSGPDPSGLRHDDDAPATAGEPGSGSGYGGSGQWWPTLTGSINLTLPLSAYLGLSDAPGEVGGHGPADADTCRDIAAWLAAGDRTRWCVTFTDADGRAVAHACARRGPPSPPPRSAAPPGSPP